MNVRRRLRHAAEALPLLIGMLFIPWLPRRAVVALARGAAAIAFRLCRRTRRIALANLTVAFGDSFSDREKAAIVRESFETFALVVLDLFWFGAFTRRRIERYVHVTPSMRHYTETTPAVVVTGHFGNWEVMGLTVAIMGHPCLSAAAPLDNPVADRVLNKFRRTTGQGIRRREGALRVLLRTLRAGGRAGLVMDQNTLPSMGGEFVNFFGLPTPMSRAAAVLSLKTGAAIVHLFCVPTDKGRYDLHALPPVGGAGSTQTEGELTRTVARTLEDAIREHPGKWLWMYKRWKYVPEGASRDRYPFYVKRKPVPAP